MPEETGSETLPEATETTTSTTEIGANEEKTLTQAEVDKIVKERLARERAKYADYDDLKQKAAAADSSKTDMEKLQEQIQALTTENETNKLKALRSEVASSKKVPANLLTGTTQEELEEQADALLEFAKSQSPAKDDKDGEEKKAATGRPKESLRSGAANNDREPSAAEIAKSVLNKRHGF